MGLVFVIGGSRSGKSKFALDRANALHGRKVYIATAEALDDEMKERIERHKKERSREWDTIEEPLEIASTIKSLRSHYNVMLLDCITLWLGNLLTKGQTDNAYAMKAIEEFLEVVKSFKDSIVSDLNPLCHLIIVSNEVGMGIVPDNELSRRFRDMAGLLNQRVAEVADEVYMVVAGIPIKMK